MSGSVASPRVSRLLAVVALLGLLMLSIAADLRR